MLKLFWVGTNDFGGIALVVAKSEKDALTMANNEVFWWGKTKKDVLTKCRQVDMNKPQVLETTCMENHL